MLSMRATPYLVLLLASALVAAALALYAWRRRTTRGSVPFTVLMLSLAIWSLGYVFEVLLPDLAAKVLWAKVEYVGIVTAPVAYLAFALQFAGIGEWLTRRNLILVSIAPFLILVLVWTDEAHHLIWSSLALEQSGPLTLFRPTYGVGFFVFIAYSYVLMVTSTLVLARTLLRPSRLYRGQAVSMLVAVLLPWVGNVVYLSGLSLLDPTPFAFAFSGMALAWGLFRYRLLEIVPVARAAVVEHMHGGMLVLDAQDRVLDLNPAARRILGRTDHGVIGQAFEQLLPDRPDLVQRFEGVKEAREEITLGEGEQQRHLDLQISPIHDREGRFSGRIFLMRDVTGRRRAEAALEEGEKRYRQLVEEASDVVFTIDLEGRFTYVNPPAEELTGYPAVELLGTPVTRLVHPAWRDRVRDLYRQQRDKEEPGALLQFPIVTGYGQVKWVEQALTAHREGGRLVGFQSAVRDITERKQAEEAEQERRAIAEALRDVAAALNSTLDRDEVLDRILENAGRVVPHDAASIMLIDSGLAGVVRSTGYGGRSPEGWVSTVQFEVAAVPNLRHMVETGQPFAIPDTRDYPDWVAAPEIEWVRSWAGAPIRLEDEVIGFLNLDSATPRFFTDEHAERLLAFADQAAVALRNAQLYAELAERNKELDAFSHTIAHDLKAPLNTIIGYVALIAMNPDFPAEERENMDTVEATALRMGGMIDQLLQLTKLREATETAVRVEMGPVVMAAVDRFKADIERRDVKVEVSPDLPPALGHAPWLEEVFANLIGNAIKYIGAENPAPCVSVRGEVQGGCVRYEVADNGLGIAPEQQERLFEMFTRFHHQEATGLGLGLPIVHRIVTKLGGQIEVQSTPGQGSTFSVILPALDGDCQERQGD